jgi:hypothetical protein
MFFPDGSGSMFETACLTPRASEIIRPVGGPARGEPDALHEIPKGTAMRYTIRELKLGEILDQAVNVTKDHFGVLLGITGVLLIPYNVISGLVQLAMMPQLPPNPTPEQALAVSLTAMGVTLPVVLLGVYIIAPITNAAVIYAISNAYLEKPISVGDSFKRAFQRILALIGTWLLVGLAIMGGLILCIIPGILAAFWFALATQVVVIENAAVFAAMKRSKELMTGNIGTMFVLGLLVGLINIGITLAANLIPQPHVQVVVTAVVEGVVTIFASAAFVVFYFSCRCKHEQFDLALLAQSVGTESPADAPTGAAPQA